jgi:peptidoglycan/xylan/chitin deacetylase (PgdA/CDA1 family)
LSLYVGDSYEDKGAIANDNVDGDITDKIVIDNKVDTSKEGTYEVIYTITDSSGLVTTTKRSIEVKKKPEPARTSTSSSSLGCGEAGVIYLTFDDGPNSTYTPVILDVLKKYNVKATFFVTSSGPDSLIKREYDEGHAVGLHSSSHAYEKIYVSSEAFWRDMNIVRDRVKNITGSQPTLLRFPGGVSNTVSKKYNKGIMGQLAKEVEQNGYSYFDWNISSGDAGGTTDPNVEYNNVISGLSKKRGNVILMHDIKKHTSIAIDKIVKYGLDNGYTFKVLDSSVVCHQRINN